MAGQLYIKDTDGLIRIIENIENVGIVDSFVVLAFTDGSTVMERSQKVESIQFTPYPTDSEGANGQSENNTGD